MKLLWTRSTLINDSQDLITWAFDHRCSHFAVSFFDESVMFHSTIGGVQLSDKFDFYKHRLKVFEIELPTNEVDEAELLKSLVETFGDYEYDYKFFWWLAEVGFMHKILGKKPPTFVEYENPHAIICHEVIQLLPDSLIPAIDFRKSVMPQTLYIMLSDAIDGMP